VRRLARGHLDPRLVADGDRTSNLPVPSRPALPPDPLRQGPIGRLSLHTNISDGEETALSFGCENDHKQTFIYIYVNPYECFL
jgi:hypothetical protein